MSPTYDSGLIDRLVREAREDDERMEVKPWIVEDDELYSDSIKHGTIQLAGFTQYTGEECQQGIARTRNNLSAMADQLEAARREIDRLNAQPVRLFDKLCADRMADEIAFLVQRKVISSRCPAADALLDYRDPPQSPRSDRLLELEAAIDAYRAAKGKT